MLLSTGENQGRHRNTFREKWYYVPAIRSREGGEMSTTKIGIFWPGDYHSKPNELALPIAEEPYAEG
jgi:hypothetical protein